MVKKYLTGCGKITLHRLRIRIVAEMAMEMTGDCAIRLSLGMSSSANVIHFSLTMPCERGASLVVAAIELACDSAEHELSRTIVIEPDEGWRDQIEIVSIIVIHVANAPAAQEWLGKAALGSASTRSLVRQPNLHYVLHLRSCRQSDPDHLSLRSDRRLGAGQPWSCQRCHDQGEQRCRLGQCRDIARLSGCGTVSPR